MKVAHGIPGLVVFTMVSGSVTANVFTKNFLLDFPSSSSNVQALNGLKAEALFIWDDANPSELVIELTNTSTGVPAGVDSSDQLLTAVSFDFGHPGYNGDPMIVGGNVILGPGGTSFNMDVPVSAGDDLSGEWGYGNMNGTGLLTNFVSATTALATPFGGTNLVGPTVLDGPQGGISTIPPLASLGGLGAVADSVIITLQLDAPLTDLNFLDDNGVMAEFGSDAAHVVLIPEPATLALITMGFLVLLRRRR